MIKPQLDNLHLELINRPLDFQVGDLVKVHYKIVEGNKERIQIFEGIVIAIQNRGASKTFTVRRVSFDVGVERIFPLYSPNIEKIETIRSNKVRRAKLYFLRDKSGKESRLKEVKKDKPIDKMFDRAEQLRAAKKAATAPTTQEAQ